MIRRGELVKSLILQFLEIVGEGEREDRKVSRSVKLPKIWNVKVKIIPLVVGSLGAILKQLILREFSIIV